MTEVPADSRPAWYAAPARGRWRDWWTLLHPPYTAWHLSYVLVGAGLATHLTVSAWSAPCSASPWPSAWPLTPSTS